MRLRVNFGVLAIAAIIVASIVATSCEREEPLYALHNAKEIRCNAGDQPTFSFSAESDWRLSSDATDRKSVV